MTGAWIISDAKSQEILRVDQGDYGQERCVYQEIDEARAIAEYIVQSVNKRNSP